MLFCLEDYCCVVCECLEYNMVRLERRKGFFFSMIILGVVVSGIMYYYICDYWGFEVKVRFVLNKVYLFIE